MRAETLHPEPLVIVTDDGPVSFQIEIADTAESRAIGLMHRPSMAMDQGMLFCFDGVRKVMMWMRNTLISLDMIFIDQHGLVSSIAPNNVPLSEQIIASVEPVLFVLELNSGSAKKYQIKKGQRVQHSVILSCASRLKGVGDAPLQ